MANESQPVCARDVMSQTVVSIGPQDTVHDALALLVDHKLSALPVVNHEGRCIGVLSCSDLIGMMRGLVEELSDPTRINAVLMKWLNRNMVDLETDRRKVATLMSQQVVTVDPDTALTEAAEKMVQRHVHHLPVVDAKDHLVGIVSTLDLVRGFKDQVIPSQ